MALQINLPFSMWNYKLSGVYKLTFADGSFYIGSSVHLRSRAAYWAALISSPKENAGVGVGASVFNKILERMDASFNILELCAPEDVRDRESFYLDESRNDSKMLSNEELGAWKAVLQYTQAGVFVKKHYSIQSAARYIGCNLFGIQRVLSGERKSLKGFVFVYEHDYHDRRKKIVNARNNWVREKKKGRDVIMSDSSGKILGVFKTIAAAAKVAGVNPACVARALTKIQKTSGGFFFDYQNNQQESHNMDVILDK